MNEIELKIGNIIREVTSVEGEQIDKLALNDSLFKSAVLDSLTTIKFIMHLEKEFHIKIKPNKILKKNLASIAAIAKYVESECQISV